MTDTKKISSTPLFISWLLVGREINL